MAAFTVTDQLGVDLYAAYDAIVATNPENPGFPQVLGSRVTATDGSEWIFAKLAAGATVNQNETVLIDRLYTSVIPCSRLTANAPRGYRPGVYQGAQQLTANMAAWFMISGSPNLKVAGLVQPNVTLYTTDVSGVLGVQASGSQFALHGMYVTVTASGTTASALAGLMTFPTIGPLVGSN